ncbi:hypothetical protein CS006_02370 [Bifidobacterium primatium]|uniref:Uncharacterized protein n=1 Tax=Bifidobacterium primatium TaxID=2045438 RepID=A0A2M9HB24_9BIFI|nr:hypothetical protein CS006_02370 [Bifidobacterium primatium]
MADGPSTGGGRVPGPWRICAGFVMDMSVNIDFAMVGESSYSDGSPKRFLVRAFDDETMLGMR